MFQCKIIRPIYYHTKKHFNDTRVGSEQIVKWMEFIITIITIALAKISWAPTFGLYERRDIVFFTSIFPKPRRVLIFNNYLLTEGMSECINKWMLGTTHHAKCFLITSVCPCLVPRAEKWIWHAPGQEECFSYIFSCNPHSVGTTHQKSEAQRG